MGDFMRGYALGVLWLAVVGLPGQAQTPSTQAQSDSASRQEYERAFRGGFRTKFVEQCLSGASKAAGTGYDLVGICACAADSLLRTKTVDELSRLGSDLPGYQAEIKRVTGECVKTHGPAASSP